MTQEEKQLLLKDLSARSSYGVMFDYNNNEPLKVEGIVRNVVYFKGYNYQTEGDECYASITECKPYLRSMSSMTEEESKEFALLQTDFYVDGILYPIAAINMVNWLNKKMFDYNGLIPMGLALEAPEGMYK
jgi:hypothetical protein